MFITMYLFCLPEPLEPVHGAAVACVPLLLEVPDILLEELRGVQLPREVLATLQQREDGRPLLLQLSKHALLNIIIIIVTILLNIPCLLKS